tara:strand:- start:1997 stop:2494 length:498 start_codon:yes stop_codon:yes gene_type:complete
MSYLAFKAEVLSGLQTAHTDKQRASRVLSIAYVNLISRHMELLTGGGTVLGMPLQQLPLQAGLQTLFLQSYTSQTTVQSQYNMWAPYIYTAWAGQAIVGPIGAVAILNTGVWSGPPIPPNLDPRLWIDVLTAVITTHIISLSGTYTNFFTGITTPWSGALLQTFP